jgi:ABC-type lipoprotein export system ATPase subunit
MKETKTHTISNLNTSFYNSNIVVFFHFYMVMFTANIKKNINFVILFKRDSLHQKRDHISRLLKVHLHGNEKGTVVKNDNSNRKTHNKDFFYSY